ncbi:MAG: hypothetical protein AAGF86_16190, partial [Pseudomonadota bacterium]
MAATELTLDQRKALALARARRAQQESEQSQPDYRENNNVFVGMKQNLMRQAAALPDLAETIGDSVEYGARVLVNPGSLDTNNPFERDGLAAQASDAVDRALYEDFEANGVYAPTYSGVKEIAQMEGGPVAKALAGLQMVGEAAIVNAPQIAATIAAPVPAIATIAAAETEIAADDFAARNGRERGNLTDYAKGAGVAGINAALTAAGARFAPTRVATTTGGAALKTAQAAGVDAASGAGQGALSEAMVGGDVLDGLLTGALVDGAMGGVFNGAQHRSNPRTAHADEKTLGDTARSPEQLQAQEEAYQRVMKRADDPEIEFDEYRDFTSMARTELDTMSQTFGSWVKEMKDGGLLRTEGQAQAADDILQNVEPGQLASMAERMGKNTKRRVTEDIREAVRKLPNDAVAGKNWEQQLRVMDELGQAGIARNQKGPFERVGEATGTAVGSVGGLGVGSALPGGIAKGVPGAGLGAMAGKTLAGPAGRSVDRALKLNRPEIVQKAKARQRHMKRHGMEATDTGADQVAMQNATRRQIEQTEAVERQENLDQRMRSYNRQRNDPTGQTGHPFFEMMSRPPSEGPQNKGIPPGRAMRALESLAQDGMVDIPTYRAAIVDPETLMGQGRRGLELTDMIAQRDRILTGELSPDTPEIGLPPPPERMIPKEPSGTASRTTVPAFQPKRFGEGVRGATVDLPVQN